MLMKKSLLLSTLLLCGTMGAQAQWNLYKLGNQTWVDTYGDTYEAWGEFLHVSGNGQYAVGYESGNLVVDNGGAFLWQRSTPDALEFINTTDNRILACDVTNDGIIVGSFEERGEDGEEAVCYPGYRTTDGIWHQLPVPDNFHLGYAKITPYSYCDKDARAVTPDGKYIVGPVFLNYGEKEIPAQGTTLPINYLQPILWEKTDDGYAIKQAYTDLGAAGKSYLYEDGQLVKAEEEMEWTYTYVYDISNDGSIIACGNRADCGGWNPAIIRNGELIQLFNCDKYYDEEHYANFDGGLCWSIDCNNNVYGYFIDVYGSTKYFVYTADGKLEYIDSYTHCATKQGTCYGGSFQDLGEVIDCSEDGTVVAGGISAITPIGDSYAQPALAVDATTTSIDEIRNNVGIDYRESGNLYVNGEYNEAVVYNAAGQMIATGKQGTAFSLSSQPAGTYIVKVSTSKGLKSFKVIK